MRPYHRKLRTEPMRILVRHADAGLRGRWPTDGEWRGLSRRGQTQAEELAVRIDGLPIARVLASPALRCLQTVEPLARERGVAVEPNPLLSADADPKQVCRLLTDQQTENAVLCTHRELLLGVFSQLALSGTRLIDGLTEMAMGAAWAVYGGGDLPVRLEYLRPLWASDLAAR